MKRPLDGLEFKRIGKHLAKLRRIAFRHDLNVRKWRIIAVKKAKIKGKITREKASYRV